MKKDSLKLQSYNIIKDKIIRCEYAPNTLINEEALREELGVSRTPIRDALSRLEQEGLIQILPKRASWFLVFPSAKLTQFSRSACCLNHMRLQRMGIA